MNGLELLGAVSSRGKRPKSRRAARAGHRRQWLSVRRLVALALLVLVTVLYAGPLRSYYDKRELVRHEQERVALLREQHDELTRKLKRARTTKAIERSARDLAYVKPGERLYIVKGIDDWRREKAHSAR